MIGTIRKHSKILWGIIITVTVITFVFWGAKTTNSSDRSRPEGYYGSIAGEEIKPTDFANAQREAALRYFFSYGDWPDDRDAKRVGFDIIRETYFRLLLIQKQKQFGIHVSDETVASVARQILETFNRGRPVSFDVFDQQILRPHGLGPADFERFLRHDLGVQQLIAMGGMSGKLVTPQEARLLYEREHQEVATDAVFFSASNYLSGITVTPEAVGEFFTNQMARYRLPDRVQVSYVAFEFSNYLAQSEATLMKTNFNEQVERNFEAVGTNYYKEAKTPEEVKAKIRADLILKEAMPLARKAAYEFVTAVSSLTNVNPATFEKLAKEKNLTAQLSPPFDREEGPTNMVVGADFIKQSFDRTADEPFAGPLSGRDAFYVIVLDKKLPSEIPPFEKIRDQVTTDFKLERAAQAARAAGEAFAATVTNGLAAGKTFSNLCVTAGVTPISVLPLSLSTRSVPVVERHVNLNQYKGAAFMVQPGQASPFMQTAEGGFLVFVRERLGLELAKITAELPEFLQRVRLARQNEAYQDWFRKEAERALRDTPVFRQQQPPTGGVPKK